MIRKYLKGVDKEFLIVSFWSGIGTLLKAIFSVINIKFVAVILGPSGTAILGNLTSLINSFLIIGSAGINTGTIRYTTEYQNKNFKLSRILSAGTKITLLFSGLCALAVIAFSVPLAKAILFSSHYFYIFILLGISVFIYSITTHFLSIINGRKKYSTLIWANNIISISSILFSILLTLKYNLTGALIAAVGYQSIIGLIVIYYLFKTKTLVRKEILYRSNWNDYKKLLSFSLVGILSAILVPLSQLYIRELLLSVVSIESAGYWESLNRLSGTYLTAITSSLSIYYLPKLAEIKYGSESTKFVSKIFVLIIFCLSILTLFIYLFREDIVLVFFDSRFIPLKDLLVLQFIGDLIKIGSWLFAYQLIAKSKIKIIIGSEIIFFFSYLASTYFLVHAFGLEGSLYSYIINYFLYFISMIYIFYIYNRKQ